MGQYILGLSRIITNSLEGKLTVSWEDNTKNLWCLKNNKSATSFRNWIETLITCYEIREIDKTFYIQVVIHNLKLISLRSIHLQ